MKRPRGLGTIYRRGRKWWIRCPGGKAESSGSTRKKDAEDLLDKRLGEVRLGRLVPDLGRACYADLERMLLDDMRANGRRSLRVHPLRPDRGRQRRDQHDHP